MSRQTAKEICRSFSGAEVSDPWGGGQDVWKVGGKMFASADALSEGYSIKTDSIETAQMLIEAGVGVKARYFHGSWINISWDIEEEELRLRIAGSYGLVRTALPRKLQLTLAPFD
jgi:predicted DNA-binding protein (MmcQ/YjbR family)